MDMSVISQTSITYSNLTYMKNPAEAAEVSRDGNVSSTQTVDAEPQVDTALSCDDQLRAEVREVSAHNHHRMRGMNHIRTSRIALHKVGRLLHKTRKLLEQFARTDFDAQDIRRFTHKLDKIITKLGRIAAKAGIELEEIEEALPEGEIDLGDLQSGEIVPELSESPDIADVQPQPPPDGDPEPVPTDNAVMGEAPVLPDPPAVVVETDIDEATAIVDELVPDDVTIPEDELIEELIPDDSEVGETELFDSVIESLDTGIGTVSDIIAGFDLE